MILNFLQKSPTTFYDPNFIGETLGNACFNELNADIGWNKNEYNGYKLNRETIVFVDDELESKLIKGELAVPPIWGKDVVIVKFPQILKGIKVLIEEKTGWKYNIALGNRYKKGKDKIAFHSDNEEFGNTQSIASISVGIERLFTFKSKSEPHEEYSIKLHHGSLLFMGINCQENYTHGMKTEKITENEKYGKTRINVTFRVWNY